MSGSNGHRWSKWWWADDRNDPALRMCCLAARGLWKELLGIMFEAGGYLLVKGACPTMRQLALLVSATEREVSKLIAELGDAGVFSRTDDGTIYSRRMVRDIAASEAGREHIAKRWNGSDPNSPPNRDPNSPPNRDPSRDPTSPPISPPPDHPPYLEAEVEAETDSEEGEERKRSFLIKNSLPPSTREGSGGKTRLNGLPPDQLKALFDELEGATSAKNRWAENEEPSADPAVSAAIRRMAKACRMAIPYGEVRSADAQFDAMKTHPAVVGADAVLVGEVLAPEAMGLRWQPQEPIRTPAEQMAEILGISLTEAEARLGGAHAQR